MSINEFYDYMVTQFDMLIDRVCPPRSEQSKNGEKVIKN